MKDFLGNEIKINDEVIYVKRLRTGSSSTRKIMFKGKALGIKSQKLIVQRQYTNEWSIKEYAEDIIFPKDIVSLTRIKEVSNEKS